MILMRKNKMIGTFKGVFMVYPAGSIRLLVIDEKRFPVAFDKIYKQTKNIKEGDKVELEYKDEEKFNIKKVG